MRLFVLLLLIALVGGGCFFRRAATSSTTDGSTAPAPVSAPIVKPDTALIGEIARVNQVGRFVVIRFPVGNMARAEQHLYVYRDGLKMGEVKVTGSPRDDMIAADLVAGEAKEGDQVRSN